MKSRIPALPKEVNLIIKLTNEVYKCNLQDSGRQRNNVNARMTCSYVLRQRGYVLSQIGGFLNKDHATILHYLKNVDWYLKTDKIFLSCFQRITEEFNNDFNPVHAMALEELKKEVFSSRTELKELNLEVAGLKLALSETNKSNGRVEVLVDMVKQRTRLGTEREIEGKLHRWYNGVYN